MEITLADNATTELDSLNKIENAVIITGNYQETPTLKIHL